MESEDATRVELLAEKPSIQAVEHHVPQAKSHEPGDGCRDEANGAKAGKNLGDGLGSLLVHINHKSSERYRRSGYQGVARKRVLKRPPDDQPHVKHVIN